MKLNTMKTGLVFGKFVALMHAVWMLLIYLGVAQTYMNWVFGLHLLTNPFKVLPFSIQAAVMLIIFTFLAGYVMGFVFAFLWNLLHKGK